MTKLIEVLSKIKKIANRVFKIALWLFFIGLIFVALFYFNILAFVQEPNNHLLIIDFLDYKYNILITKG